jgi:Glutathione S-transferase, N-terminal domain
MDYDSRQILSVVKGLEFLSPVQFPVLQHGDDIIPDSSAIFKYLQRMYPEKMAIFTPPDTQTYAPSSPPASIQITAFTAIAALSLFACFMLTNIS